MIIIMNNKFYTHINYTSRYQKDHSSKKYIYIYIEFCVSKFVLADVDILYKPMNTELWDSSIDKEDNGRVSTKK